MRYLVDANVLSEPTRPTPATSVLDWLQTNERHLVIDPIVLGEIRFGIHLLPSGRRKERLERWFHSGIARILCLDWNAQTGLRWAELLAKLRSSETAMPIKESLIAASALQHGLTVATRDVADFTKAGVRVVNPFEGDT